MAIQQSSRDSEEEEGLGLFSGLSVGGGAESLKLDALDVPSKQEIDDMPTRIDLTSFKDKVRTFSVAQQLPDIRDSSSKHLIKIVAQ